MPSKHIRTYRQRVSQTRDTDLPIYKEWRNAIYARDGRRCQMPGCNSKTKLNAHHILRWIDAPSLRYNTDNGITLCKGCHKKVTGFEGTFAAMFASIVQRNKKK